MLVEPIAGAPTKARFAFVDAMRGVGERPAMLLSRRLRLRMSSP